METKWCAANKAENSNHQSYANANANAYAYDTDTYSRDIIPGKALAKFIKHVAKKLGYY